MSKPKWCDAVWLGNSLNKYEDVNKLLCWHNHTLTLRIAYDVNQSVSTMLFRRQTASITEVLGRFVHSVWLSPVVKLCNPALTSQVNSIQFCWKQNDVPRQSTLRAEASLRYANVLLLPLFRRRLVAIWLYTRARYRLVVRTAWSNIRQWIFEIQGIHK